MVNRDNDEHLLSHALRETLDAVVSPSVRDALLNEALAAARTAELPREPEEFRYFLDGPLRAALVRALGAELGDSVAVELSRLTDVASSRPGPAAPRRTRSGQLRATAGPRRRPSSPRGEWPSQLPPRSTMKSAAAKPGGQASPNARTLRPPGRETMTPMAAPPPEPSSDPRLLPYNPTLPAGKKPLSSRAPQPPSSKELPRGTAERLAITAPGADTDRPPGLPLVLIATREVALARKFSQWVDARVTVQRVTTLGALLRKIEDADNSRVVIVVDCASPSVRPKSLAAVAEELSPWVHVVLWGADDDVERDIAMVSPLTGDWLIIGTETTAKDVALRCATLVG